MGRRAGRPVAAVVSSDEERSYLERRVRGRHPGVTFAFGHGHLGLTLSAATARLVAEQIAGRELSVPLDPFRADRF